MLTKILLFLALIVGQILASSSYIEDGKRAKLFEIMDNEVPTFKITIPDNNLVLLKQAMQNERLNMTKVALGMDATSSIAEFDKVKNATLVVEINDTVKEFNKVTFDIGGNSARTYGRQGFNIKIRDKNKDLFGRTYFRIRSDPRDATYLRSKLCCDMLNRLGIPSISANYIRLYVNEEYFGFYIFMDSPKIPWIEQVFGEKDTKNLYKCKEGGNYLTLMFDSDRCENEDDKYTDRTEWTNLLTTLDNAQSVEDIEDIFDVDQFSYLAAFDYLIGSWDHFFLGGHNYSMYKNKNTGKWIMIYYDFDSDLGQDASSIDFINFTPSEDKNYPYYTIEQWFHILSHLAQITIWDNTSRFESKLAEVINKVFNPAVLFPHIDDLKDFIRPYVLFDKTPNENGINPGILNFSNPCDYSMAQWEANSDFTTVNEPSVGSDAYGIKYWILERYRAVCIHYNLECDPVYMDENYKYTVDKDVEGEINTHKWDGFDWRIMLGIDITDEPTGVPTDLPTDLPSELPTEEPFKEINEEPVVDSTTDLIEEPIDESTIDLIEESDEEVMEVMIEESNKEFNEDSNEESDEE